MNIVIELIDNIKSTVQTDLYGNRLIYMDTLDHRDLDGMAAIHLAARKSNVKYIHFPKIRNGFDHFSHGSLA